jgi:hypothetical protein
MRVKVGASRVSVFHLQGPNDVAAGGYDSLEPAGRWAAPSSPPELADGAGFGS